MKNTLFLLFILGLLTYAHAAHAQDDLPADPDPLIETSSSQQSDAEIAARINEIFNEISSLTDINVSVQSGVVTLSGQTTSAETAARAEALAIRVEGVVTVENNIARDVSVSTRVSPALTEAETYLTDAIRYLPLLALSIIAFTLITAFGWMLARWDWFWRRITPNAFIAELAKTTIRAIFIVLAAIAALSLLDATALLGALLGAAGVIGLAVGFAVRDTIENYIASIMLSLRQPFRPNDHVVIDDQEGHVIRLTSRSTILMTLQGNHLRIPNSTVFKAVILNHTRNSERRFEFELGVDADDDPIAAIEIGVNAIESFDFVLTEPAPLGVIKNVGDSNIVIFFAAWIDQSTTDFSKSRSVALSAAKDALEENGFALPEPIYRLRFDENAPPILRETQTATISESADTDRTPPSQKRPKPRKETADVSPDSHITKKVDEERREEPASDLLNDDAPVE